MVSLKMKMFAEKQKGQSWIDGGDAVTDDENEES